MNTKNGLKFFKLFKGTTVDGGQTVSSTLNQVVVTVNPSSSCNLILTNNQFCAGQKSPVRDSCQVIV